MMRLKDVPINCPCIVLSVLVINVGTEGPYFLTFFEFPEIIQQVYIAIDQESFIPTLENSNPHNPIIILKTKKTTKLRKMFAAFWALLGPVF